MRQAIKTVSSKAQKFIPSTHKSFDEGAKEIKDRPLIIMGKPMNREDRYNLQSLIEVKGVEDGRYVSNLGTVSRYIWNNCAVEVLNVVAEEGDKESVKGYEKDRLFDARGLETEVAEFIRWVQDISRLDETEAKN